MSETLEKNIRFKAILIYLIVAVICGGMVIYIYKFRSNIDDQKSNIEQYHKELSLVNKLIYAVNDTQSEVNLYVATKQIKHYKLFNENLDVVEQLIDSLRYVNPLKSNKLKQINDLLVEKGKIVSNLNNQFSNKNPIESLDEVLKDIDPAIKKDTVFVTATMQDTTIYSGSKKGFWKKLSELFSPSKENDTVTSITTSKLDTLTIPENDTLRIVSEVTEIAVQAKEDYVRRIIAIERNLNSLIVADQEISTEITTLLIELHSQTVHERLSEIQKSEKLIRNNNTYSIISSGIALTLIFIFILLIISDVNKGYKLRKNIEKANIRIKQIMDSRHKLLLSVSHDVKTPLNSILGTLELKETKKEFHPQELRIMRDAGDHILALLNNLLEFSSLEQGTSNISKRNFNLYKLCNEIIEMFIPLAKNKNLTINHLFDFDEDLTINSDPLKIKQILINILSNSVKYTIKGSIQFNVRYSKDKLYCDIQDTGVGVPQSEINNIFDSFKRVDQNIHLSEGSGFGLFVVKGLINLLGGNIEVTSEINKGTHTRILLPAKEVFTDRVFIPKKILVVDDDMAYLIIIRDMLSRLGHIPSICNNITEFERLVSEIDRYDEVLTDMEMEDFSGIDVLNKIINHKIDVPVSIITAREDIDSNSFINMGFKAHIRKPVSMEDLEQLFGGNIKNNLDLKPLTEMLKEDSESIHEVLASFVTTTTENISQLRSAVLDGDFKKAQFICHKMLSIFIQIGATEKIDIMKKVDSLRSIEINIYSEWENDILEVIEYAEKVIIELKKHIASH